MKRILAILLAVAPWALADQDGFKRELYHVSIPVRAAVASAIVEFKDRNKLSLYEVGTLLAAGSDPLSWKLTEYEPDEWRLECLVTHQNGVILVEALYRISINEKTKRPSTRLEVAELLNSRLASSRRLINYYRLVDKRKSEAAAEAARLFDIEWGAEDLDDSLDDSAE